MCVSVWRGGGRGHCYGREEIMRDLVYDKREEDIRRDTQTIVTLSIANSNGSNQI